jgi:hypothetical protein
METVTPQVTCLAFTDQRPPYLNTRPVLTLTEVCTDPSVVADRSVPPSEESGVRAK